MLIPKENLEKLQRYADELGTTLHRMVVEYEKIWKSSHLEKLDDSSKHAEAIKLVERKIVEIDKIKKHRRGKL
jgi:predicted RND superfamily exporter protein